jgi:hypothetical protein
MGQKPFPLAAVAATIVAVACSPSPTLGPDRTTRSEASSVTWTDGRPAYLIRCELPGGCQGRALALCPTGTYTTLQSENMTSIGTRREVPAPGSVIIRCG